MAIEIFGFAIKPEITIGDIAAVGALIASPLIFYFGYSQTRKSEQIKIARELKDRINTKIQELKEIQIYEVRTQNAVGIDRRVSEQKKTEVVNVIRDLFSEIDYFIYLLRIREIKDRNIVKYYLRVAFDGTSVANEFLTPLAALETTELRREQAYLERLLIDWRDRTWRWTWRRAVFWPLSIIWWLRSIIVTDTIVPSYVQTTVSIAARISSALLTVMKNVPLVAGMISV